MARESWKTQFNPCSPNSRALPYIRVYNINNKDSSRCNCAHLPSKARLKAEIGVKKTRSSKINFSSLFLAWFFAFGPPMAAAPYKVGYIYNFRRTTPHHDSTIGSVGDDKISTLPQRLISSTTAVSQHKLRTSYS